MKWWEYLDWSTLKRTFEILSKDEQQLIKEKGYWSKGKGRFEANTT